jgi:hypothetical protein
VGARQHQHAAQSLLCRGQLPKRKLHSRKLMTSLELVETFLEPGSHGDLFAQHLDGAAMLAETKISSC